MKNEGFDLQTIALWEFAWRHLHALRTSYGFSASDAETGYYNTLFGRDSLWILIFLLETVRLFPAHSIRTEVEEAGADIILSLCAFQGERDDPYNEEQPGKIIHEYRDKFDDRLLEMKLGFVEGRLYSGFDQTFLFVTAYRRFIDLYPNNHVVEKAWFNVEKAINWIDTYADEDKDGLFEYTRRNPNNLLNQVWKDSFDSIATTGVDIPLHPIAWIEIQAYAYRALGDAEYLYMKRGYTERAEFFNKRMRRLRARINADFWIEHENCFAIGLTGDKKRINMISSNAGHLLWAGAVDSEKQSQLVKHLLQPDMCTQYGLRTLSSSSAFYSPFSYHRGNIWPFDNAIIAMGLLENGYKDEAFKIIKGVSTAITIIGVPIELYVVLDDSVFIKPQLTEPEALLFRRSNQENRNQGWTAAALVYFAALLAKEGGEDLSD